MFLFLNCCKDTTIFASMQPSRENFAKKMKKNEKQAHDFSLFRYNRGVGRRRAKRPPTAVRSQTAALSERAKALSDF